MNHNESKFTTTSNSMKLLIIPSWYPSNIHPESGTFFRERALILQNHGFNITIAAHIVHSARDVLKFIPDPKNGMPRNDNEMIVTEKGGKIKLVNILTREVSEIGHNLNFVEYGQGGLLDILYHEDYIYISYTENRNNWKTSTSIARAKFNKNILNFKNIFQANPPIDSPYHFGSRLAIKDNYLFASAGERGGGMIAQDGNKHPGSIIRIYLDGGIPKDNPRFEGKSDWLPEIYQIGVRNPQGLALSPFDGKIYMSNHGAKGGDWFGEAKKGENYGWKILGWGGTNYSGIPIGPKWKPGFTKAIQYWVPSIAVSYTHLTLPTKRIV